MSANPAAQFGILVKTKGSTRARWLTAGDGMTGKKAKAALSTYENAVRLALEIEKDPEVEWARAEEVS